MIVASPAEVLTALLVARGLATRPATLGSWPVTTSSMPDDEPDNRITIYNTAMPVDGKLHKTGETLVRPNCQIRVRSKPSSAGWKKLAEILNDILPLISQDVTTNDAVSVSIVVINLLSGPAHIGQEEKNQRQHHTANVELVLVPGA